MNYIHHLNNLTQVAIGRDCVIDHIHAPADAQDWQPWLTEIGFIAGEHVVVKRRSILRKGAVVVRVGLSTFALHPDEAACVWVAPMHQESSVRQEAGGAA